MRLLQRQADSHISSRIYPTGEQPVEVSARPRLRSFEQVVEEYGDRVLKYCFYQLGSLEDAEDLAQRVFERAYSAWERFDPGQADPGPKVRSWLFTIAHNEIVNRHRARVRHQSDSLVIASTLPASGPTPEELAILADNHGRLYTAISALSPELRQVVELRLFGLNDTEIADFLNRTPGAIRTAQCRAVARLRSLMVIAAEIKEGSNG